MPPGLLGRTNTAFPSLWLSLSVPNEGTELEGLVTAAQEAETVIDISAHPALFGGYMRGTSSLLMTIGGRDLENAVDEKHASDLTQAHLIEVLSGIGREHVDFYYLVVRRPLEEYQLNGALEALELAKQEGHVRFLGLCCKENPLAALGLWQFHDAFDSLLVSRNFYDQSIYSTLKPLADERRVGIVTSHPLNWDFGISFTEVVAGNSDDLVKQSLQELSHDHPVLIGVRSRREIEFNIAAAKAEASEKKTDWLALRDAFDSDASWPASSKNPSVQRALNKRKQLASLK